MVCSIYGLCKISGGGTGGVDVTHTDTCTVVYYDCGCGWLVGFSVGLEEYMDWIFWGGWDFGYPHLYALYPFRIAVNTS